MPDPYDQILSQGLGLGDQETALQLQMAAAQRLREAQATGPGRASPMGALFSGAARVMNTGTAQQQMAQAQGSLQGVQARRNALVRSLPQSPSTPGEYRALQRALAATGDPTLGTVGKSYENEALAKEKDDLQHDKLVNALIQTGMRGDTALRVADIHYNRPMYVNTPGDAGHSGVITTPDETAPGGLGITPVGVSKPPSVGAFGGPEEPLSPMALEQYARAALKDPTVLSRLNPRGNNRTRVINEMAVLEPTHPYAELWAGYKGDVAAGTDTQKSLSRLRPYERMLGRNADIVLSAMDKIPDSEVSVVNYFTRNIARQMGDTDVAAFNAALNAFSTEAARVLNNPNLVGQLTDSARNDLAAVHSGNFSKKQLQSVIKITQAEAQNRLSELESEGLLRKKSAGARSPSDVQSQTAPRADGKVKVDRGGQQGWVLPQDMKPADKRL